MLEPWSAAGAVLMTVATVPQAVRLLRTRRADDFSWSFIALTGTGIALLMVRAIEIREWAFVAVNGIGTSFWVLVALVKALPLRSTGGPAPAAAEPSRADAPR